MEDYKNEDQPYFSSTLRVPEVPNNPPDTPLKIPGDVQNLIPLFKSFKIQNIEEDYFVQLILDLNFYTFRYFYENYSYFIEYNIFDTLFSLAFAEPAKALTFFQSVSLKILKNLINYQIPWYSDQIIQMGAIQKACATLYSNYEDVVKNGIKLLIAIAPIDISYTQDILTFIHMRDLLKIDERYKNHKKIKMNIGILINLLARCDVRGEIFDFIEYINQLINEVRFHVIHNELNNNVLGKIIIIFSISHNLMKNKESVLPFYDNPQFIELLNFSLKYREKSRDFFNICHPAILTIDLIHYHSGKAVKGLNYENLVAFISEKDEVLSQLITETFINILASQELTILFITQTDVISQLIAFVALDSPYESKRNAMEAIVNAIIRAPKNLLPAFNTNECMVHLLNSLQMNDDVSYLCKVIECLGILLSQSKELIEDIFLRNFDPVYFNSIFDVDDPKLTLTFQHLLNQHSEYFLHD